MKQRVTVRRAEQAAQTQGMRLRTRLLGGAMALVCFGVLAGRLYWLQVVQHDFYAQRAVGQQLRKTAVPAPRSGGRTYYAKGGESLWDYAYFTGVPIDVLMRENPDIGHIGRLEAGEAVYIP